MKLWIEVAQGLLRAGSVPPSEQPGGDVLRTLQTEERFVAVLAGIPAEGGGDVAAAEVLADRMVRALHEGVGMEVVTQGILSSLRAGQHLPLAVLQVIDGHMASLVEIDAPPLFLTRKGAVVLLPVLEEPEQGRLVRRCEFKLENGDHLAMVSEGFIRAKGWSRSWSWRDIATSTRRLTATGCDAQQLLGALLRMVQRLAQDIRAEGCAELAGHRRERDITVLAMYVRPMRSATVWSGPPTDRANDRTALDGLMAEPGTRIICGDTTSQLAARLLGAELQLAPRPAKGWGEVPPLALVEGIDLVTEGLVTLRQARQRLSGAKGAVDLPKGDDAANELARALLMADRIRFIVGLAVNPQQAADAEGTVPLRRMVIEELVKDLRARGKMVPVEYL